MHAMTACAMIAMQAMTACAMIAMQAMTACAMIAMHAMTACAMISVHDMAALTLSNVTFTDRIVKQRFLTPAVPDNMMEDRGNAQERRRRWLQLRRKMR